jgi:hypothetical protein
VVGGESLLLCELFEGVVDTLPFPVLPPSLCLYPRQLVFIIGLYLLLGLRVLRGCYLGSGFILWSGGSVPAVLILHFYELVHLFLVEVFAQRPFSLGNLNL